MTQIKKPQVLFFYAGWCGPSQAFRIVLKALLEPYSELYLPMECYDTDQASEALLRQWHVLGVPTTILVGRYGKEVGRLTGYNKKEMVMRFLQIGVM